MTHVIDLNLKLGKKTIPWFAICFGIALKQLLQETTCSLQLLKKFRKQCVTNTLRTKMFLEFLTHILVCYLAVRMEGLLLVSTTNNCLVN